MQTTYVLIFVLYCIVVFAIGLWAKTKNETMEHYFVAGRDLGIFSTGMAYYSTAQSSSAFIGMVGWAYAYGWASSNYVSVPIAIGAILTWGLLAKRVWKTMGNIRGMTVPDLLEHRFPNKSIRLVSLLIVIIAYIPMMVAQIKGCGILVQSVFKVDFATAAAIGLFVVALYVMMGGMRAVAYTDVLQGFMMIIGIVILAVASLIAVGGFTSMNVRAEEISAGITNVWGAKDSWGPLYSLSFILLFLFSPMGMPIYISKFFAMKDLNVARFAMPISYTCVIIASFCFPIIGVCAKVLYPNLKSADTAFTTMATGVLPPVVGAIVLVSLFAAVMSTVDAMLLAITGAVVRDFYSKFLGKVPGEKFLLRASMITTIAVAFVSYIFALTSPAAIMTISSASTGLLGASFVAVIVGGVYFNKMTWQAALSAMVGGFVMTLICTPAVRIVKANVLGMHAFVWGFLTSLILAVVVSKLTQKNPIMKQQKITPTTT